MLMRRAPKADSEATGTGIYLYWRVVVATLATTAAMLLMTMLGGKRACIDNDERDDAADADAWKGDDSDSMIMKMNVLGMGLLVATPMTLVMAEPNNVLGKDIGCKHQTETYRDHSVVLALRLLLSLWRSFAMGKVARESRHSVTTSLMIFFLPLRLS